MEPDEREPIRGRQARTTRARVGRSGPLFTSSSGSSDGEGSSAAIRPAGNIEFPPNLLGHYYVRDSTCGTSTMMELPITETQHVPIAILPSPGSASKRPSSLTPSSVTTARNLDLDLGAASPVGSSHHQQHRYQGPAAASPAPSSTHSSTSRISRLPPPPGYVSNSCYQLGCSPQCPLDAPSRRRTTSPRSYAATYSPEPSPRGSTASVPYKFYKYPRHSCDPGLSTAVGAGQWQTPPRGGHSPLGHLPADPAGQLGSLGAAGTAEQLRQHLQQLLQQQQLREQEPCGPHRPAGLHGLGPPPRPYQQPHRSPAPLPSRRPEAGDAALTDWVASAATHGPVRRRARSVGSGLPLSASVGLDGDRPAIPLPAMPSQPPETAHGAHCHDNQPCLERICTEGAMYDGFELATVVVAAQHSGNALGGSPARTAGAFLPAHVSPRTSPTPASSIPYQQQPRSPRRGLQQDPHMSLLTSPLRLASDPQRCSLSELDSIAGGVGAGVSSGFVSDNGGGGGDGVGTRMGSRTGLYDITTILRQDGLVETVLHINTGVSRSPRSLSPSPLANARTDIPQHHHHGGSSGGGSGRSPALTRPRMFPASIGEAGNFLAAPCSLMSELATAAGVPVGASASRRANSAAPHDGGWGSAAAATAAAGAAIGSPDLVKLAVRDDSGLHGVSDQQPEDQLPLSWREVGQERPLQANLQVFEGETAAAELQELQRLNEPGSPNYSLMANPLFRSYGGAIIDPDPMMPNIDSVSPARLTDDGGPTSSGTRTPRSSTRRPMLLLGGPRASSSGGGASSSCVAVEAAPDVVAEGAAAASLGNSACAASEGGDAEEDPFSLPLPSPANLRLMHANSDANSSSSSGRLSPSRLLSAAASEGGLAGPSSSGSGAGRSAFSCSPTRHSPSASGMRVLDLTCLQQHHCDHHLPPAASAAAEPLAILDGDNALPEAMLLGLSVGPHVADGALHELPSLSPCLAGGILDFTWESLLPVSVLLTASIAADTVPQMFSSPSAPAAPDAATGAGPLPPATLDGDEPSPELPLAVRYPYELPLRVPRSSGGSVDSEATAAGEPHVPVPIILAAATEVQMQGADMMALALQMDRKSEDIMAAALDARQRSDDMLAAAEEARVQSFTLIAEAVTVKIHCADMLAAARIVQLQGADLMVAAAREHEVEEEEVLLQARVERQEADEQGQAGQLDMPVRNVEAPAVAPAADAVLERPEQQATDADVPSVVNEAGDTLPSHGSERATPPLLSLSSSGDVPVTTRLWPPLELTNIASRMATAEDDDPLLDVRPAVRSPPFHLGVGAAAAAYLSFPGELTLDVSPAPGPYPDDCEKARAPTATAAVVSHDSCSEEHALESSLAEGAGSAEAAGEVSEQGDIWQGWAAAGQREQEEGAQQEGEGAQHSEQEEGGREEEQVDEGLIDSCQIGQASPGVAVAAAEVAAAAIPVSDAAAAAIALEAEEVLEASAGGAAATGTADEPAAVTEMEHAGAAAVDENAGAAAAAVEPALATAEVTEITTGTSAEVTAFAIAAPPAPAVQAANVALAAEVAAPPAAAAAGAAADAGSAAHMAMDEETYTQEELDEFMELALEFSAEAMGIRAAEAMRASNGEEEALEALARAGPFPFPQHQTQPPALLQTELAAGVDNASAVAATSSASRSEGSATGAICVSIGFTAAESQQRRQRELQQKRRQDEQAQQVFNGPIAVQVAEGNAAEARAALMTWDVDVGDNGTALLSLQPRQRRTEEAVAAVGPGAEDSTHSPKGVEAIAAAGTAAKPVVYAVTPTAVAAAMVASPAAVEPTVAVNSAPKQPSAAEAMPANASRSTPPSSSKPSTSVASSRPSDLGFSFTSAAVAPASPSTGGSTRGKARAKAKVVAAAFGATQAKAATAAAMAPAMAPTTLPAPVSPTSPEGAWSTVAPSRGHRRGVVHSRQSSTSSRADAPAPQNLSSSVNVTKSMESISSTAGNGFSGRALGSTADGVAPPDTRFQQLRAPSPVGRSRAVAAQGQRLPLLHASTIPVGGGTGPHLVPAPAAAAWGPVNNVGTVPNSPAAHGAETASDDEDSESAARGGGWLAFGSGLLASAALVCASALHLSQNPQPHPQPAHTYLHAGRATGTHGDGLKGGLLPLNMTSCPAPWLLRCVPVEVGGGARRAAQGVPAGMARFDEDDGPSGSFTEAAVTATGAMVGVGDGQLIRRQAEGEEEEEEHRMALAGLGAAVALVSHPQYAGSGVPSWLGSDPRVVSAELEVQLYEGVAPSLGDGESEAQWGEEVGMVELAAAEVREDQMEVQDAWEDVIEGPAAGADITERRQAEHAATTAAAEVAVEEVDEAPAVPAAWPIVNIRPLGVVVPTDTVRDYSSAPAVASTAAADSVAVPAVVESAPRSTARYLQGAGICLAAVVTATVSALLWAGRRRRQIPRNQWMTEWKSVWDVGPIPSPWRNQHPPVEAAQGADNGVYDAYGAAAAAAAGAAAATYGMYGNADPFGYSAGGAAAAPSASGSFGGPAGVGHNQPNEYDGEYYQQHHHNNDFPATPRRATRDVAPNAGLLDCYYLRSNRLVPRGSPRSPAGRVVGGAGGLYGGSSPGGTGAGFAAGGQGAPPRTQQPQQDVWYHWLRNRTIFCFNQQKMSPEARRLMADQHH